MNGLKKVAFYTLGCKLNFTETSALSKQMKEAGFQISEFSDENDIYVINTCSVTDNADKKCRKIVRDALSVSPTAQIVVVGCYAQLKPKEISNIPGVSIVLGAAEKFNLVEHLDKLEPSESGCYIASEIADVNEFVSSWSSEERTRSFLKVQDGCDYTCAFCTIPLARGKSRSDSISNIVSKAKEIAAEGFKEIVLTGVNIGDFGKTYQTARKHSETFTDLVKALDQVEDIERFRISSIEPNLLKDEIIELVANSDKFMPHFHIPLQSGSDKILSSMRRRYKRELYTSRVEKIKKLMPHACIGVDVIVGFPGETDIEFKKTYNYLNELDISYLHVFKYSERPNTAAIHLEDIVPEAKRKERSKMLRILSEKKRRSFYNEFTGTKQEVLLESKVEGDKMYGFTENYIKVAINSDPALQNSIQSVKISKINDECLAEADLLSTKISVN